MATTLSAARVGASVAASFASTVDLGTVTHDVAWSPSYNFTDGTGANQAKVIVTDTRTLAASASEDLDLAGGMTDAFGNAITFAKVKAIAVQAAAGNTNDVVIGGASATQVSTIFGDVSDTIKVKPGGLMLLVAPDANGYSITAGTADLLKIANSSSGTGVTYTITVIGTV